AENSLFGERIVEGLDLRILARNADARAVICGPEVRDLGRIEQQFGSLVEQRPHHRPRHYGGDYGAVLRRHGRNVTAGAPARRARHVLRNDIRIPGDMAAVVARESPRIDVVAPGGWSSDQKSDCVDGGG